MRLLISLWPNISEDKRQQKVSLMETYLISVNRCCSHHSCQCYAEFVIPTSIRYSGRTWCIVDLLESWDFLKSDTVQISMITLIWWSISLTTAWSSLYVFFRSSSHDRICDRVCENDSKLEYHLCLFGKIDCRRRNVTSSLYSTISQQKQTSPSRYGSTAWWSAHSYNKANFLLIHKHDDYYY